jgi:hypothetical protein
MPKTKKARKRPAPSYKPQEEKKHPDEWERDLNPHRLEGQNIGRHPLDQDPNARTAADIKDLVRALRDFSAEELREIPIVPGGAQLKQGAVYLDLSNTAAAPFTASGGMTSRENSYVVPKAEIPYEHWNRLLAARDDAGTASIENSTINDDAAGQTISEADIDKTLADSFPASDPPSWTLGREAVSDPPDADARTSPKKNR